MIKLRAQAKFVNELFADSLVYYDEFKTDLIFIEIDCLNDSRKKLSIELGSDWVGISSVDITVEIDFSLHDRIFKKNRM